MTENKDTCSCLITGEIIEIYERNKSKFAKIKSDPGYIDICIDKLSEAHLNDKVVIEGRMQIKSLSQDVEEDNFI